jgi:hypothetical protein
LTPFLDFLFENNKKNAACFWKVGRARAAAGGRSCPRQTSHQVRKFLFSEIKKNKFLLIHRNINKF